MHLPDTPPKHSHRLAIGMGLLLALGLLLRLRQYLFNRSLWLDEAYLAASFVDRDLPQLLLEPLSNNQAAPLAFLLLTRLSTLVFGLSDWSLRLLPLICGLTTLYLSLKLAQTVFTRPWPQLVFVGLMSLSPVLVYYSSEFKQYQGDVMCTVLLVWLTLRFDARRWQRDALALALCGAACVWLSHSSVFVLAGCGLVLWGEAALQRQLRPWLALNAMGAIWILSFGINYAMSLRQLSGNGHLTGFWTLAYAPPPTSLEQLHWYLEAFLGLVHLATRHVGVAHHGVEPGWFDGTNVLMLVLAVLGLIALARMSWRAAAVTAGTVALVLAASALHLYPFRSRLILFLVPMVHLWLAALVDRLAQWRRSASLAPVLATLGLLLVPATPSWGLLRHPSNGQDIKLLLNHAAARLQPSDGFLLDNLSFKAFDFHAAAYGLEKQPIHRYRPTPNRRHDARSAVRSLCRDPSLGRTWVIISHRLPERQAFVENLSALSAPLERVETPDSLAVLHDFRTSPYCQRYRVGPSDGQGAAASARTP